MQITPGLFSRNLPTVPGEVDRFSVEFEFTISGKSRPKFDGRTGRVYMPTAYMRNKDDIKWFMRKTMFEAGKHEFLSVKHFYMHRTIGYRKLRKPTSKADAERLKVERPVGGWASGCAGAPDTDNLIGTLMDSCQGIVYPNDSSVVLTLVERVWSDRWGAFFESVKLSSPEWET